MSKSFKKILDTVVFPNFWTSGNIVTVFVEIKQEKEEDVDQLTKKKRVNS